MSNTTNNGIATEEAAPLAYAADAEQHLNLPTATYAEDAKALGLPIGVYGEAKYGECRSLTKEELAAEARKANVPDVEKAEA
jgi:hypothetical protein